MDACVHCATRPAEVSAASHRTTRSPSDTKTTYFGQYVTLEGSKNLHTYQYHGCDNSLIYKFILSRMNDFLIQFIPMWVAPNVITLLGLILVSISHCIVWMYCPDFQGQAPSWVYFVSAMALFAYQTLDNLDGKQARRTSTSSPLGLLFDHGCDAINMTIGCCTMASVIQLGPGWKTLYFFSTGILTFVCATWEEYYTGILELPVINGPTEGILLAIGLKVLTGIRGPGFWLEPSFVGQLKNNDLLLLGFGLSSILTICSNIYNVRKVSPKENVLVVFTRLLPFLMLTLAASLWVIHSPSNIMENNPRKFIWTLGMLHSKLVLHLMLAHLCGEEYHPFRKTLVPLCYVCAHWAFCSYRDIFSSLNDEQLLMDEFFFISLVAYIHLVISVVHEVSRVLNIPIFTIPLEKQIKTN